MTKPDNHGERAPSAEPVHGPDDTPGNVHAQNVQHALNRGLELVHTRGDGSYSAGWYHEAHHVGDLSILSISLAAKQSPQLRRVA